MIHPLFEVIEDKNYEDGNFEYKYQVIAGIIERLYVLPVCKVMMLDEIVYNMSESGKTGIFEYNMSEILNRTSYKSQ